MKYKVIHHLIDLVSVASQYQQKYPFLLNSQGPLTPYARYQILMGFPSSNANQTQNLKELDSYFKKPKPKPPELPDLPFYLGYFIYLGFEACKLFEPKTKVHTNTELPDIYFQKINGSIIIDRKTSNTYLIGRNQNILKEIQNDIQNLQEIQNQNIEKLNWETESTACFMNKVKTAQTHLIKGDNFQTNISRQWKSTCNLSPFLLHQKLTKKNPAPFSALVNIKNHHLISCSPERLLHIKNQTIQTKPIAGTAKADPNKNQTDNLNELKQNLKECAEHVMIVDLLRNDMNRICKKEVTTNPFMNIESYPNLHHIVSTISGKLTRFQPSKIIQALFPGGSVTGCPKIKTIEIITNIEQKARTFYTGSLGYICETHQMDLNILIRTLKLHNKQLIFNTGSGIVINSIPEQEDQETKNKAKPILDALHTNH